MQTIHWIGFSNISLLFAFISIPLAHPFAEGKKAASCFAVKDVSSL